jgi:hypothetical protein
MATAHITASALIQAPARDVYAVIADYRELHPRILPKPPFVSLEVDEGGIGAGTTMRVYMRVLGQTQMFRSVVSEPEPGRVLVETNDNGYITTFTVEPRDGGQQAYVTIETDMSARTGIAGAMERWFVSRLMRPAYFKELDNLAEVAKAHST